MIIVKSQKIFLTTRWVDYTEINYTKMWHSQQIEVIEFLENHKWEKIWFHLAYWFFFYLILLNRAKIDSDLFRKNFCQRSKLLLFRCLNKQHCRSCCTETLQQAYWKLHKLPNIRRGCALSQKVFGSCFKNRKASEKSYISIIWYIPFS